MRQNFFRSVPLGLNKPSPSAKASPGCVASREGRGEPKGRGRGPDGTRDTTIANLRVNAEISAAILRKFNSVKTGAVVFIVQVVQVAIVAHYNSA